MKQNNSTRLFCYSFNNMYHRNVPKMPQCFLMISLWRVGRVWGSEPDASSWAMASAAGLWGPRVLAPMGSRDPSWSHPTGNGQAMEPWAMTHEPLAIHSQPSIKRLLMPLLFLQKPSVRFRDCFQSLEKQQLEKNEKPEDRKDTLWMVVEIPMINASCKIIGKS